MAVVVVTAQNVRLDDAEANTKWINLGTGPSGQLQFDFYYQGANSYGRKGTTGIKGVALDDSAGTANTEDLSGAGTHDVVLIKYCSITPGLLETLATPGIRLEVGSGTGDFYYYDVQGRDTYPFDKSWLIAAIAPSVASHRTGTTGSPTLTACAYYGMNNDQTNTSKDLNFGMDAVDVGTGLTLTGGDGGDTDGVWQDLSDHDWGTTNNRFGYIREAEGAYIIYGTMIIGNATATVFQDTGSVCLFPEGLFPAGWSGIEVGLANATNDIDFISNIFVGKGTAAGEDTRPVFNVTGTTGTCDINACSFDNFSTLVFTSATTVTDTILKETAAITQGGATITGCSINRNTAAIAITADDAAEISDCTFTSDGTGHAIEIAPTGAGPHSIDLSGNFYSGYAGSDGSTGNETILINPVTASADITLNIVGGGGTPTIMEDAGYTGTFTLVVSPVTTTVTVKDTAGAVIENARVLVTVADGTNFPYQDSVTLTSSGTTATATHTAHGLSTNENVQISGAVEGSYNGAFAITVTDANTYTYTMDASTTSPATGTIIATVALISGLTNASGIITDTRSFGADQVVEGRVRKSSASPFYKTSAISATVDANNGVPINIQLLSDE